MSGWAIVAIVAIVMSGIVKIFTSRHDRERGIVRNSDGDPVTLPSGRDDSDARREIQELRERIKVLERIATDGNSLSVTETRRISQEIEALRDRQDG